MQDAEGGVIVAGNDDKLAVRANEGVKPNKQAMLCHASRCDISIDAV